MARGSYPEEIEVTVPNWEKYNPRTDVKRNWWFKISNDIFEDPKIQKLTDQELRVFLHILTRCSKTGSKSHSSRPQVAAMSIRSRKPTEYFHALNALARYGLVTLTYDQTRGEKRREDVQASLEQELTSGEPLPLVAECAVPNPNPKSAGKGKRAKPVREKTTFDFEALYRKYPKKRGKARGLQVAEQKFSTQQAYEDLSLAIDKYCASLKKEKTEFKYIQLFSTFVNGGWLDWTEENSIPVFDDVGFISAEHFQKENKS